MLHRTVPSIQVRKQISGRRISRLSLHLYVLPPPFSHGLSSVCVVLWSLPLEDYGVRTGLSSPRVLSSSTRSRTEASAALFSSTFTSSHLPSHCSPVHLRLLHVGCLPARPRHELSRPSYRGSFKTTCTPNYRIF